jgi:peptidoglycan/LPS O-acetylase OafA/YrhL
LAFLSGGAFAGFAILGIAKGFSPGSIPMYLFGYSLLSVSFGCGLLAIVACEKPLAKHRILCAAGVGAYSIYLFHQVILSEALQMIGPKGPGAYLAALVGTIAAAIACWMLIERPFIRYARLRWDYGRSSRRLEISDHRRDVTRLSERRLAGTRGTDSEIFARFDR